ncbi:hypothetical protein XELAEV_18004087mg [Xenopus laevis]|uniref:GIY-YIG domain-containing protein n=1 Tax=Xenopus laevis TaxID=8355 RepID=A0A974BRV5_XENLA|nr:hypothetical protein XELAEV_18004087mg [Xenopus laevis]
MLWDYFTKSFMNGTIYTDLYRKNVDKNNQLNMSSFHIPKVKRSIPKGQFVRAKLITSCSEKYNETKLSLTKRYVGQTSREVKVRIQEHKSNFRNFKKDTKTDTSVSRRFIVFNNNVMQLQWCVPAEAAPDRSGHIRRKRLLQIEGKWIKKLNTLNPDGLNYAWSLKSYL